MKVPAILAAAMLALAPAIASANQVGTGTTPTAAPAAGPVASEAQKFGDELDPDFVIPIATGTGFILLCVFLCTGGGGGGGGTTTTTTTGTTSTTTSN